MQDTLNVKNALILKVFYLRKVGVIKKINKL